MSPPSSAWCRSGLHLSVGIEDEPSASILTSSNIHYEINAGAAASFVVDQGRSDIFQLVSWQGILLALAPISPYI